jgi:hypothetical protein
MSANKTGREKKRVDTEYLSLIVNTALETAGLAQTGKLSHNTAQSTMRDALESIKTELLGEAPPGVKIH